MKLNFTKKCCAGHRHPVTRNWHELTFMNNVYHDFLQTQPSARGQSAPRIPLSNLTKYLS